MHIYTYTLCLLHTSIHIDSWLCVCTHIYTYVHTYVCTYIHGEPCMPNTHKQTDTHVCLQTCMHMSLEQVCFPMTNRVLVFAGETLHYLIAMMSFHYIINDVMDLPQNYK